VQRLLKDSALPLEKSLQNFNLKRLPAKATRQLRTLLDGSFLGRKENVLVFGNPGSGKSHLLTALAQELVVVGERKMHFTKCALLMQDLLAAKRDLRLRREIKRLGRYDGLIIDDLGYLQQSRDDMEVVFIGRALRTRQRTDDQQSAVLQMGSNLQRRHDDGSGDRPAGAS
jgi:DNA replication protein DnaC